MNNVAITHTLSLTRCPAAEFLIHFDPVGVHTRQPNALAAEVASILARLHEPLIAEDAERIVLDELHRWYGCRGLATLDHDRLADATIAICTV